MLRGELESQLAETQQEVEVLSRAVGEVGEANEALSVENAELQTQLLQRKGKQPMSRSVWYGAGGVVIGVTFLAYLTHCTP